MKIIFKNPNQIKPDPKQPRRYFGENQIKDMAQSMLHEGVINPVEIDDNNVIVTGEIRWRAAKEAGLKKIPVKQIKIDKKDRFLRQLIENVHHNSMTPMETSNGIFEALKMVGWKPSKPRLHGDNGRWTGEEYIEKLSQRIGLHKQSIYEYLSLQDEPLWIKEWLSSSDSSWSFIREANKYIPEKFKEKVKRGIVAGKINSTRKIASLGKALERNPEKKQELFALDLLKLNDEKAIKRIGEISPEPQKLKESNPLGDFGRLVEQFINLMVQLKKLELKQSEIKHLINLMNSMNNSFMELVEKNSEKSFKVLKSKYKK